MTFEDMAALSKKLCDVARVVSETPKPNMPSSAGAFSSIGIFGVPNLAQAFEKFSLASQERKVEISKRCAVCASAVNTTVEEIRRIDQHWAHTFENIIYR